MKIEGSPRVSLLPAVCPIHYTAKNVKRMAQHYRREKLRRNLLEMYKDNALRSQSYMDVNRLHMMMALMTEVQTKQFEAGLSVDSQQLIFDNQLSLFSATGN